MNNYKIDVYVNPLLFFGSEFSLSGLKPESVSYQSLMGFLCAPGTDSTLEALVQRYNAINVDPNRLPVAPVEGRLFERLVWPLRHAKGSFVVGNYLGVIALCGLVAEMAAIFAFDLYNERSGSIEWDEARQKGLFGSAFERLGQERRVSILKTLKVVNDDLSKHFDVVRERRRRYLHFFGRRIMTRSRRTRLSASALLSTSWRPCSALASITGSC